MDELWSCPAKINLTLRVSAVGRSGYHPIESIVQAVGWTDSLRIKEADDDHLIVKGADLPTDRQNLVWKAVDALALDRRPPLEVTLDKSIPEAAGLGGGSSNAACMIAALAGHFGITTADQVEAAAMVGADVAFFLAGGTALMTGAGSTLEPVDPYPGFVLVVAVPDFPISTGEVYRRWDELGEPAGKPARDGALPPSLRGLDIINDLTPAAADLEPRMGDVLTELAEVWGRPVMMSGSGSSAFACFADMDEAADAATEVSGFRDVRAVRQIGHGVQAVER